MNLPLTNQVYPSGFLIKIPLIICYKAIEDWWLIFTGEDLLR